VDAEEYRENELRKRARKQRRASERWVKYAV
jgi:hypothetical protein